jgi:hypothetical protein
MAGGAGLAGAGAATALPQLTSRQATRIVLSSVRMTPLVVVARLPRRLRGNVKAHVSPKGWTRKDRTAATLPIPARVPTTIGASHRRIPELRSLHVLMQLAAKDMPAKH